MPGTLPGHGYWLVIFRSFTAGRPPRADAPEAQDARQKAESTDVRDDAAGGIPDARTETERPGQIHAHRTREYFHSLKEVN